MVEAMANSVEDYLIDGLSFKLQPGSSYVTQKRSCSFYTSGSNSYSPTGTKVIRIQLNGDDWLDPSSVRIAFKLVNDDATAGHRLRPLCGPWSFFRRMRILCGGGQLIEDYTDYNRVHEMFSILQNTNVRANDDAESYGYRWDDIQATTKITGNGVATGSPLVLASTPLTLDTTTIPGITGGSWKYISFRPLLGLLSQPKFIPLRYCALTIEMEVVNSLSDPIIAPTLTTGTFNTNNCSTTWHIEDVQVKCDLIQLDTALNNSYVEHLLSGKSLPIQYDQLFTLQQTLNGNAPTTTITRSATRLKEAYFTLYSDSGAADLIYKPINLFEHPMRASAVADGTSQPAYDPLYELEWQVQVGSRLYPEMPCRSVTESFKFLKQIMHYPDWHQHSMDIRDFQFRSDKHIMCFDFQKVAESGYTGVNTKAGDLMVFKLRPAPGSTITGNIADSLYITLVADCILNIKDTGVEVFD